ncbi:MAG: hypothetical protein H3C47_10275 [Candidatus Cloacimonetes bacterium]|nr:hypothetical protein [Candidatus Cloacimonadota bacterium]
MKSTFLAKKLGLPVLAVSTALMFTGCGSSDSTSTPAANNVAVNGVAVKGPFKRSSSVSVFGLKQDGTKTILGSGQTLADDGSFSVSVPRQAGPVIVEVAGNYDSEVGATDATGTIKSVAFIDGTTAIMPDLLVTPVSHIVANIIEENPGNATSTIINQTGQSVSAALGLTGLNVLTGQAPAIFANTANPATVVASSAFQKQLGAVIAGFEKMRGNTAYNDFFTTRLSQTTTGGTIPLTFQADLATGIKNQLTAINQAQISNDSTLAQLTSTASWSTTGVDLNLHTVDLFADNKAHSFGQSYTTSMTAGQSISVMALIGASATANLTYEFSLISTVSGGYITPLSSMLTGFSSTGAVTGATSFTGVFSTTIPAIYTFESEVRQNGRTEVAKAGVTIHVNAVATTPPPASADEYSFTFGNFTSDMISGKKFHTSYDGKAAAIDKDGARRQVISFLSDGNYVRVHYDFPGTANDIPSGFGTFAARGTWAVVTESTFGVIRMTETARFPIVNSTISTEATAVTSEYRIVLDPAATASNLQLKDLKTIVYDHATNTYSLDPANPFKDKIGGAFGSADIFTPSNICGGSTSLPTLPATTTLLTPTGQQDAKTSGCAEVPAQ